MNLDAKRCVFDTTFIARFRPVVIVVATMPRFYIGIDKACTFSLR